MAKECAVCSDDSIEVLGESTYECVDCDAVVCSVCYDDGDGTCPDCGGDLVESDEEE